MASDATSDACLVARRFQITLNEPETYDSIKTWLTGYSIFKYLISAKEKAPTTGHEHIHIFVCYRNTFRIPCPNPWGAHVEICKGSNASNIKYIKKDGNIIDEIGECPHQGSKFSFSDLRNMETPEDLPVHLFKTWTAVKSYNMSMSVNDCYKPGIQVFFVYGPSGSGKTRYVAEQIGESVFDRVSFHNNFWEGVSMDKTVEIAWYDDFRDSDMKPSEFIKFIDYYANNLNVKGSHVLNHYKKIYITSVQDPETIYRGLMAEEPRKQWLRRLEKVPINDDDTQFVNTIGCHHH